MRYAWDDEKNTANRQKHGIDFNEMAGFDWDFAALLETQTIDFEERELWAGPIGNRLFAVVVTERHGAVLRIISLRRATNTEINLWRKEFSHG
ncbi:BrnT family toxin [Paracoccus alkanivorans]|uniref:BrnT family toxin n=2 Tax=Paracoccus alkanivorans TaxID=2116655 RepID=A0A3M0MKC1_9RHOB|nr:BrnT family toxin [Paracoccus alkanivorans]